MFFSVAITTYNRPVSLAKLVSQVSACTPAPAKIIIVDSSDVENVAMKEDGRIKYVRSSHRNQPYQRYLAYRSCSTELIFFLDDDLEIIDFDVFKVVMDRFQQPGVRGVSTGFVHHNTITDVMSLKSNDSVLFKIVNFLSGVPVLRPGKIYLAGLAGPRPSYEGPVDYFNGAVMAFYRSELDHLFDPVLFEMFELKQGMGEDKIISMTVGLKKTIWFVPTNFFVHPPTTSSYFQNARLFQAKVMFSRLFLSLRFGKMKHYPVWLVYVHFYYFSSWRLAIAGLRYLLKPSVIRADIFKGIFKGILLTFAKPMSSARIGNRIDWEQDAQYDTNVRR